MADDSARFFFGIALSDHLERFCSDIIVSLQSEAGASQVRWTERDNLHLTLKFLGVVPTSQVEAVMAAAGQSVAMISPFEFDCSQVTLFPDKRRPRMLTLRVDRHPVLSQLSHVLDIAMSTLGFEREARTFKPHITLGRLKPGVVFPSLDGMAAHCPSSSVTQIHLYSSEPTLHQSHYTCVRTLNLAE